MSANKKYRSLCCENVVYIVWAEKWNICVASRPRSLSSPASDCPQVIKRLPVFLLFSNFNLWQTAVAVNFCNSEGLKTWGRDLVILTKEVARSELAIKVTILVKVKSYNKIRETIQAMHILLFVLSALLACYMSNRSSHRWPIIHVHGMGFLLECMMYKYIKVPAGFQVQGMRVSYFYSARCRSTVNCQQACKYSAPASWCLVQY